MSKNLKEDLKMVRELVDEELEARFEELKGLKVGTKDYETAVSGISKLMESATKWTIKSKPLQCKLKS